MTAVSGNNDLVQFGSAAGIARITINREGKRNALSLATIAQLLERLD